MRIYIVAVIKNNKHEIDSYIAYDLDEKKSLVVPKNNMISVIKSNKAKIHNARQFGKGIAGTRYSLNNLSYFINGELYNPGILVIKQTSTEIWDAIRVDIDGSVRYSEISLESLKRYIQAGIVLNYDKSTRTLNCERIQASEIKKAVGIKTDLLRRALDNNDVWDMETFETFMQQMGWTFKIDNGFLLELDNRCDIIHLPRGIIGNYKGCMGESINHKIKKIILSPTIERFKNLISSQEVSGEETDAIKNGEKIKSVIFVDEVYFQKSEDTRNAIHLDGFGSKMCINKAANIPNTHSLQHAYCYTTFNCHIDMSNAANGSLESCFMHTEFMYGYTLRIGKISHIIRSIIACKNLVGIHFTEPNELVRLYDSINNIPDIKEINLHDLEHLYSIQFSFMATGIEKVDLSNVKVALEITENSFEESYEIKEFKLPSRVHRFCVTTLAKTKLNEIVINAEELKSLKISNVISDNFKLKLIGNKEVKLFTGFLQYKEYETSKSLDMKLCDREDITQNIEFNCPLILIHRAVDENISIKSTKNMLNIFKNTRLLGESIWAKDKYKIASTIREFDSADLPNVSVIPVSCFYGANKLNTVILDRNIVEVRSKSFKQLSDLKILIVSENLKKIDSSAFSDMKTNSIVRTYVVKNSYAAKYLAKYPNLAIVEVDSVAEARRILAGGDGDTSKLNKLKMILGGNPAYAWVFGEKYIKNAGEYVKVLQTLFSKHEYNRLKLNISKYISEPINKYPLISKAKAEIEGKISSYIARGVESINFDKTLELSDKYISISNVLTDVLVPMTEMLECINQENITIRVLNIIVTHNDRMIWQISVNKSVDRISIKMCVITQGDILQFIGMNPTIYTNKYEMALEQVLKRGGHNELYERHGVNRSMYANRHLLLDVKCAMSDILNAGDMLINDKSDVAETVVINNLDYDLSDTEVSRLLAKFRSNTFLLKEVCIRSNNQQVEYRGVFMDLRSMMLFDCIIYPPIDSKTHKRKENSVIGVKILGKYDYSELHNILSNLPKSDEEIISENKSYEALNRLKYGDSWMQQVKVDTSKYDINCESELVKLAKKVFNTGCTGYSDSIPDSIIKDILSSAIVKKLGYSLNRIKKEELQVYGIYTKGTNYIPMYEFEKGYQIGFVQPDTKMSDTKTFSYSILDLNNLISMLYRIGYTRANNEYKVIPVSNNIIEENLFLKIYTIDISVKILRFSQSKNVSIAIDKLSGYVHIIVDNMNGGVVSVMRFREIMEAYYFMQKYIVEKVNEKGVIWCLEKLATRTQEELDGDKSIAPADSLGCARTLIIDGYVDGMVVGMPDDVIETKAILSRVCKQPAYNALPDIFIK